MTYEQISVARRGAVGVVTLDRPEVLNAWTPKMSDELKDAFRRFNDDRAVGAIVLTGAGRAFCAGADIGENFGPNTDPATAPPPGTEVDDDGWVDLCRASKPLVAAIHGPAVGLGLSLVLSFDRIVAGQSAKLSARYIRMGLVPELAASHFLVSRCGWGNASWLALTGAIIDGTEAARLGLIDRLVDDAEVLDVACADAALLATGPQPQLRMIKELLTRNAVESDLGAVQKRELRHVLDSYLTAEHHEAVRAFLDRRQPDFAAAHAATGNAT